MAGILYYLPKATTAELHRGDLVSLPPALAGALADLVRTPDHVLLCAVTAGPDGGPGVIVQPQPADPSRTEDRPPGYHADRQTWVCLDGRHLGYWTEAPPEPADLERRELIPGYTIQDAYDRPWSIPVARSPANVRGHLPWGVRFRNGRPVVEVAGKHSRFWTDSARVWDLVARSIEMTSGLATIGAGYTAEEDAFLIDQALAALSINYRVGPEELELLDTIRPGWLTGTTLSAIVNAIVDFHARAAWEAAKKKTPSAPERAGVSSTPGVPAA